MGRGSVWEGRVRLARRAEEADPQRSVTDKQRRQRALPSQTLRAAGLSGLDCVGSGGTDRRRSAPLLTALPNPEFPSRRTPLHFQTGPTLSTSREHCLDLVLQIGADALHGPLGVDEVEAVVALHPPEGVAHAALVLQEAVKHVARQA